MSPIENNKNGAAQTNLDGLATNDSYFIMIIAASALISTCCCIILCVLIKRRRRYNKSKGNVNKSKSSEGEDIEMNNNTSVAFNETMRVNSTSATSVGSPIQPSNAGMLLSRINTMSVLPDSTPYSMANSIGTSPVSLPMSSPFDLNHPLGPSHVAIPSHSRNQSYGGGVLQSSGSGMKPKTQARGKRAVTSASIISDMNVIAGMVTPMGVSTPMGISTPIGIPPLPSELNVNTGEDFDGENYDDMYEDPNDVTDENMYSENDDGSGEEENEFNEIYHQGGITRTGGGDDDIETDDGGDTDDGGIYDNQTVGK